MKQLQEQYRSQDKTLAARFDDFAAAVQRAEAALSEALVEGGRKAMAELTQAAHEVTLHPGELAPASGQYVILDTDGKSTGEERTAVQGKHLPPTPEAGQVYRLVDATRNNAGVPATS